MKPENVVIDDERHVLLTDFGMSKEGVKGLSDTNTFCGSLAFMAPEVLCRQGHGRMVDVYGLGVMTYCMLTGRPPFFDRRKQVLVRNIKHMRLLVPKHMPLDAISLIRETMAREPMRRLGAERTEEVKSHAWFAAMDWDALMRREVPVPGEGIFTPLRRSAHAGSNPTLFAEEAYGKLQRTASTSQFVSNIANWDFASPAAGSSIR